MPRDKEVMKSLTDPTVGLVRLGVPVAIIVGLLAVGVYLMMKGNGD